jgi:glutamate synthase domain-containing protein 2/glutamate synthase domain-containing protein 1/glutamate synthase domain-containing protein 3
VDAAQGLYDPALEHGACGVGFIASVDGTPSHELVRTSVEILKNLLHRGAVGGDQSTGDGAGILTQLPDALFRRESVRAGFSLPAAGAYGVAMQFLPGGQARGACVAAFEAAVAEEGLKLLGWREVPTEPDVLGDLARRELPEVAQAFVSAPGLTGVALERKLYVVRKVAERAIREALGGKCGYYVPSFSCRTVVYKGLLMGGQVSGFYPDLRDTNFASAVVVFHQRYSTNTFPSWQLSQPFRFLAHNGEINTLRGNRNQMAGREPAMEAPLLGADVAKIRPVVEPGGSDSASLDNVLELLVAAGRSLPHAMLMMVPQAWGPKYPIGPDLRGFFEYHAGIMEPWDGPATVAFSDGTLVGAHLDRNGLRPARYVITEDGLVVLASEAGVVEIAPERIVEKGALRPGQMLLVDVGRHRIIRDGEIKASLARQQPYRRWVAENKITIQGLFGAMAPLAPDDRTLLVRERLFGYTREDRDILLEPMAAHAHEAVGSMGADLPPAVLSEKPQLLFSYFKQMFAQVTNPPIDSIREELVMSLMTFIGNHPNILDETPAHARLVKLPHPFLSNEDLARLRELNLRGFSARTLPMGFPGNGNGAELRDAVDQLCRKAEAAVSNGHNLVILSDRDLPEHMAPIPSLLATSAVNTYLVRKGLRTVTGLIVETGEAREVMHMALLLGYGATALNPYLAYEVVADLAHRKQLGLEIGVPKAMENYVVALCEGIRKIMSKMGISTLRSYRGAQVFEAVGLSSELVEAYFRGTASRVEGIGLDGLAAEANARYAQAWQPGEGAPSVLPAGGRFRYRLDGERHLWSPDAIADLQHAVRSGDREKYRSYAARINDQAERQFTLRGLFRFREAAPVPLDEVEPAASIVKRFVTGAMSFGSISREAHETRAVAMNALGGMSNSGEGGEDPARYKPGPDGESRSSAIKQVASGRFGVTAEYCVNAKDLQIKIAQGAKPGEGGQLPGHKVYAEIARVRHSTPGVTLISPPPHHDIYSIEDIKQLIYDLRNVNPEARVSVKLVSELGVGTVAAGVAKARADVILIAGGDGGTGASPLSSIHHAGIPWELGLAETQQTLVANGLRGRVRVQVDGQLKTGRDVVVAALLGAEEFGFATTCLVAMGCVMMRQCHTNTCPVGVATQDPELRKHFRGKPEHVKAFLLFLAEEAREIMARLGARTVDDLVGRADLLETDTATTFWKARGLDFSRVLRRPDGDGPVRFRLRQDPDTAGALDLELLPLVSEAIESGSRIALERPIRNVHRTVGTMISGRIAKRRGGAGLPDDSITLTFRGSAGQSFGAWGARGLTLILEGEANDYLGKGLSGARIVVKPPPGARFDPAQNAIAGNVLLYGATSGEVYLRGRAGERFAIRNSGATAVVEGLGDHGCEYMTGGRVVVLGSTGVNFAAGMSGGIAYVYDRDREFDGRCNLDMVDLEVVSDPRDAAELRRLVEAHVQYTGSRTGAALLGAWDASLPFFVKVFPMEYRRALGRMTREDAATEREEVVHG